MKNTLTPEQEKAVAHLRSFGHDAAADELEKLLLSTQPIVLMADQDLNDPALTSFRIRGRAWVKATFPRGSRRNVAKR